jgi:cell wall-associated NlpC family hydrolase
LITRRPIVRARLAALIACSLIATTVPFSAQAASDGSLWYSVDGGFVPVDVLTRGAAPDEGLARYQEATPETVDKEWVDPALTESAPLYQDVDPNALATGSVDPAVAPIAEAPAGEGWVDPATGQWVEPAPAEGDWVDPGVTDGTANPEIQEALVTPTDSVDVATSEWVDPVPGDLVPVTGEGDLTTGEWVDPATTGSGIPGDSVNLANDEGVEAVPAETPVDPVSSQGGGEATSGPWGEPAPIADASGDLVPGGQPAPGGTSLSGGTEPWGQPIATAYIAGSGGDGAPCLAAPQWGTTLLTVLTEGEPVEVRAETMGEWQPVNCTGVGGYVHVALISWTPVASEAGTDDGKRSGRKAGSSGGDASGEQIVSFAMQYQGYPYVYAGEGPAAFDCSGFTMFVIHNTLGIDIPHDMAVQYEMGRPVRRDAVQPGDLVFFANTFRPGMSHTGIYIGGGQFIHAENESTGVRVSDLNSDYYRSRWYGAVRFS